MGNKKPNRDFILGRDMERASYAITGTQYGFSSEELVDGKRPTKGAPMMINMNPPGLFQQDDDMWITTYGASHDAFLTIVPGTKVQSSIDSISINSVYKDGITNVDDDNLWKKAEGAQQVQYIVSKDTAEDGGAATVDFGDISDARGIGIRLPGIAGGWGRTIDLLPTDPQPTLDATGRKNDETHKLARETWKYGAFDARWDYRRGVWATYNDLIADHYDVGLGTWVFGTNPDSAGGFPFLRGRLDDVWWVRQPLDLATTNGRIQGEQTGRIMTHLEHEWYDEEEDGSASLSSIFSIPHKNAADCHGILDEHTLGPELTGEKNVIDIKSTVHFVNKENGLDGAIDFGGQVGDLPEVCCKPPADSKWFAGRMVLFPKDYVEENCNGDPSDLPVNDEGECLWRPTVQIDECELVGEHLVTLVDNDQAVALMVCGLCDEIKAWSAQLIGVLTANDAILEDRIKKTQNELKRAVQELIKCIYGVLTYSTNFTCTKVEQVEKIIEQLVCNIYGDIEVIDGTVYETPGLTDKINDAFIECLGKTASLPETNVTDSNGLVPGEEGELEDGSFIQFDPSTATVNKPFVPLCPPKVFIAAPFKCEVTIDFGTTSTLDVPDPFENCPTVDLRTPCGDPETFTIDCDVPVPTALSTEFGKCQTHESP